MSFWEFLGLSIIEGRWVSAGEVMSGEIYQEDEPLDKEQVYLCYAIAFVFCLLWWLS